MTGRRGDWHRQGKARSGLRFPGGKQAAFINAYENRLKHLDPAESVLFADAVHPTHASRPVRCWAPQDTPIAVAQTSARDNLFGKPS